MSQKVAIVTGSSSGIGYATSLMLARNGFYTYASVRNSNKSASLQSPPFWFVRMVIKVAIRAPVDCLER